MEKFLVRFAPGYLEPTTLSFAASQGSYVDAEILLRQFLFSLSSTRRKRVVLKILAAPNELRGLNRILGKL
jgi:hypothetical protein